MSDIQYIPESQAAKLAGVSEMTLCRFVEAGYLKVQTSGNGQKAYSKKELKDIFGLSDGLEIETEIIPDKIDDEVSPPVEESYWAETVNVASASEEAPTVSENPITNECTENPAVKSAEIQNSELIRLQSIASMQEKILEIREREIEELRKERDWLKNRIERHEEKSDRDQLLLLSETQMIRKLVNLSQVQKPSTMRLALEWLGFVSPSPKPDLSLSSGELPANSKVIERR